MRSLLITTAVASLAIGSASAQNVSSPTTPVTPPPAAQTEPATPPEATPDPGKAALPRIAIPPTKSDPPPAIKTTEGNNPGAPVAGANSFTEGQAKSRIEARGYTNVSSLTKDNKGIWRGTAMKDGKSFQVSLDFQGNVSVD
jgi:opacity protein-like surface antigen